MSYANGQIPAAALVSIGGGFLLEKDAAASFKAMDAYAVAHLGRHIGVKDAYRPLGAPGDLDRGHWSQWAAWERYQRGGNLAARPGTSNHGLGLAIDFTEDGINIVHAIGAQFGWSKAWSDAPGEPWHFKYRAGVWHPPADPYKVLTKAERGWVSKLFHHRKQMRQTKGLAYRKNLAWARYFRGQLTTRANLLYALGKAQGWKKLDRGARQSIIRAIVRNGKRTS